MLKIKMIIMGFAAAMIPSNASTQAFYAGQTTGGNIIYNNFSDIHLSAFSWSSQDAVSIDLNNDNSNDIYFWTQWIYYSHPGYESASAGANPLNGIEISTTIDNPNWIRKHAEGDAIDRLLNWSPDNGIFYCASSSGSSGSFGGPGFMAYRICNPDTIYGWIKLDRGTMMGPSELSIYELAYSVNTTGFNQTESKTLIDLVRISGQTLFLNLPTELGQDQYLINCYDCCGRIVLQMKSTSGINRYDLSRLGSGIYIVRISNAKGESRAIKAIL